ncbi:MAG: hypothetical protein V3U86_08235 [Acidobacteriota bacterium]
MKYPIGQRVRLSETARRRILESTKETEHIRVAREDRLGIVIQWISESMRPTGYLVDFKGVYMALAEEDLVAVE